jgi:hypothetical protein
MEKKMGKKMAPGLLPITVLMLVLAVSKPGWAIVPAPPDLTEVCQGVACDTLQTSVCSGPFKIMLKDFEFATALNSGIATYIYEICYDLVSCPDGSVLNPLHFDITFPAPGSPCLGSVTQVSGTCVCNISNTEYCDVDDAVVVGDSLCLRADSGYLVAKCENILLSPPYCITMTLSIASETIGLGPGAAVLADANTCITSCLAGPSCTNCVEGGPECLVRTKGFWGTHPNMASQHAPVTVCGVVLEGQEAGACSTSQALCTNANDYKENPPYLSFIAQLTAAKLNLNATWALFKGSCSTWEYHGRSIEEWIDHCEDSYCNAAKQEIARSGCIEALTAFNESQDTGFDVTPAPFDQPGPADPSHCQKARGNGIFVGNCSQQPPPAHSKESIPGRGKER